MAIHPDFVLGQVLADVQYDRGVVYLDRCGSLLLKLQDALGKPFEPTMPLPTMTGTQLHNSAERIVVQFGPQQVTVTQSWVKTPVRLEQIAPMAWESTSQALDVGKMVKRCGVRFQLLWEVESMEEGRELVSACEVIGITDAWQSIVGDAVTRGWSVATEDKRGIMRIGMEATETKIQGGQLHPDLASVIPKFSILLDLDHVMPGPVPLMLTKLQLTNFIRDSWTRSKQIASVIRQQLGSSENED